MLHQYVPHRPNRNPSISMHKMASMEGILEGKYPAKAHAKNVTEYLKRHGASTNGVLYLEGQKTRMIEDNDGEAPFR